MNILIVKLSAFGDIIHSLPALDDLLIRPNVKDVHWLVDSRYRFVTELFPKQVIVHEVDLKGPSPLISALQTIRNLRHFQFDATLDLQGLIKSAVLARACSGKVFGIDTGQLREKPAGWFQQPTRFHELDRHVVQQYRRVATAPFTTKPDQMPEIAMPYVEPAIHADVKADLLQNRVIEKLGLAQHAYIILHSAGGWATKLLPDDTWIAIAKGIVSRGLLPVFPWGSDTEQKTAQRLAFECGGYALPERLDMSSLCSLLSGAKTTVGPDTGVLHLAAALGATTITFWGPSASWRSAPIGERHWHIESNPACGPCFKRNCNHFICMPAIRSDEILEAIDEIITH